jgi:MOSC domain-containing protein YiiM
VQPRFVSVQVGVAHDYPGPPPWRSAFVKEPVGAAPSSAREGLRATSAPTSRCTARPTRPSSRTRSPHYDLWREEIGLDAGPGGFAENLTVEGADETSVCIGDIVRVGGALLEVTFERGPCVKIANRWGRPNLTRLVGKAGRTGWYHRVIEPGEVRAGNAYELVERPPGAPTVFETMRAR